MDTQNANISNAERIGKAVADVAKRIRIQDFDVVAIKGDTWSSTDTVRVSIQTSTRRDLNKAAAYFQLDNLRILEGRTALVGPNPVTGLGGAVVEVFGPESDETERGAA